MDGAVRLLIRDVRPKPSRWWNGTTIAQVRSSSNEVQKNDPDVRALGQGRPTRGREDTTRMGTCYRSSASWQALGQAPKRRKTVPSPDHPHDPQRDQEMLVEDSAAGEAKREDWPVEFF